MKLIKFREYIEHTTKKKYLPNYILYDPEFNGKINDIFDNTVWANAVVHYMQYTGLRDKNGHEIYEGDIISWEDTLTVYGKPAIDVDVVEWSGDEA